MSRQLCTHALTQAVFTLKLSPLLNSDSSSKKNSNTRHLTTKIKYVPLRSRVPILFLFLEQLFVFGGCSWVTLLSFSSGLKDTCRTGQVDTSCLNVHSPCAKGKTSLTLFSIEVVQVSSSILKSRFLMQAETLIASMRVCS